MEGVFLHLSIAEYTFLISTFMSRFSIKRLFKFCFLLCSILSLFLFNNAPQESKQVVLPSLSEAKGFSIKRNKPIYVHDGDTISIENTRYRLYGIDAPELGQKFGHKAKEYLRSYLPYITKVELYGKDSYGRTLAILTLHDRTTLQEKLVENGLAVVYTRYCKQPICSSWKKSESIAKEKKLGIWSSETILLPHEYRRQKKARHLNNIGSKR